MTMVREREEKLKKKKAEIMGEGLQPRQETTVRVEALVLLGQEAAAG
jgi:hypothetical protein